MSRLSPFKYTAEDGGASTRPFVFSDGDAEILMLFIPSSGYAYLPSDWVPALLPHRGPHSVVQRMGNELCRENIHENEKCRHPQLLYRDQDWYENGIYSLAPGGAKRLREEDYISRIPRRTSKQIPHELMNSCIQASLVIGAREYGVSGGRCPDLGRTISLGDRDYQSDSEPFSFSSASGRVNILAIETDRSTEPLTGENRETIAQKFRDLRLIYDRKLPFTNYQFKNAIVLIVTVSEARRDGMMRVAQEILGAAPWLVFGVWTNFRSRRERLPDPSGYIFETPLKRLGNLPDYHLPTELGVTDVRQKA